jgi:hypothetical protein
MKTTKAAYFLGSAALPALVIHPWATAVCAGIGVRIGQMLIGAATALMICWCANSVHAGVAVGIGRNFTGSTDSSAWYPCPAGAAGVDYFVEFNIDTFAVYRKSDGTQLQSASYQDFWTQTGALAGVTNGDYGWNYPRMVYDPTVQRWFTALAISDSTNSPYPFYFLLAVSATADPTGTWSGVAIDASPGGGNTGSTVSMGLDAQAVYLSSVVAPAPGGPPIGCTLVSLPKADLLAIPPIITNRTSFGTISVSTHGYNIKPVVCFDGSAAGNIIATAGRGTQGDNNNTLLTFAVRNAAGPGPATLSSPKTLAVPAYLATSGALQPDGSQNLQTLNAAFRSDVSCSGGSLFAAQTVEDNNHAAVRWYRIRAADFTLTESGTIRDPALDLFYPSIVADTNGTVVIAYNGSGTNTFVSCFARVGRTAGGVTTFGQQVLLQSGLATYQNPDASGNDDWGYFSATCVDPTDPNIFWTINAYAADTNTWATQITQLLTSPSPQLSVASAGSNLLLSWPVTTVPFRPQMASSLAGTNLWSSLTQSATTNGSSISVLVPFTDSSAFFRLAPAQ